MLLVAWATPFLVVAVIVLVVVAERPTRALEPIRDPWLTAVVGETAGHLGVHDDMVLRWRKTPTPPDPARGLRARIGSTRAWLPNASHADGLAPGSVLVLHPTMRKMPDEAAMRFVVAHEVAHAAHDNALLRCVPGLGAAAFDALLRGAVLSLFSLGSSGLPTILAVLVARQLYRLVTAWSSRRVEYAADRTAVTHTGDRAGASFALDWLARTHAALHRDLIFRETPAVLDLAADTWDPQVPHRAAGRLSRLFSTHPPMSARIARVSATVGHP